MVGSTKECSPSGSCKNSNGSGTGSCDVGLGRVGSSTMHCSSSGSCKDSIGSGTGCGYAGSGQSSKSGWAPSGLGSSRFGSSPGGGRVGNGLFKLGDIIRYDGFISHYAMVVSDRQAIGYDGQKVVSKTSSPMPSCIVNPETPLMPRISSTVLEASSESRSTTGSSTIARHFQIGATRETDKMLAVVKQQASVLLVVVPLS